MNIFLHEWKILQKSTWLWTFTLCLLLLFFLSIYPAFTKEFEFIEKFIEAFPQIIRELIGISLETFFSILGFYAFVFAYVMLLGSIQAMNIGLSLVSKESRDKTVDFLLTKPITRSQILSAKILAGLTSLVATNMVYCLFSVIIVIGISQTAFNPRVLLLINFTLFFVQCIFFALGLFLSVILPKIKSVISISLTTVFSFFILDMFNSVIKEQKLRYILPYKFFDPIYIINYSRYESVYLIITLVFVVLAIAGTYFLYQKKDFLI